MLQLNAMPMDLRIHAPVRVPRLSRLMAVALLVGPPVAEVTVLAPTVYRGMSGPLEAAMAYLYCLPIAYLAGALPALLGAAILYALSKAGVSRMAFYGLSALSGFAAMVLYSLMLVVLFGTSSRYASGEFFSSATTVLHMALFGIIPALAAALCADKGLFSAMGRD